MTLLPGNTMPFLVVIFCLSALFTSGQELYTARGYWEETQKAEYLKIKGKLAAGDSLSADERGYFADYRNFLDAYYNKLNDAEKQRYLEMLEIWERERAAGVLEPEEEDQEFRRRNWLSNGLFGLYYGISLSIVADLEDETAASVPLAMSGLWLLSPAIAPEKYERAPANTIRLVNAGRILGLGYGLALGLSTTRDTEAREKWMFGLSSALSAGLGEAAFPVQRQFHFSGGRIDMMRHYSFLGSWVTLAGVASTGSDNPQVSGLSLFAGGVGGLLAGYHIGARGDYTPGDVDAISSLTWISTGLGLALVFEALEDAEDPNALILLPAAGSIAGTLITQRGLRNIHLTNRQGSTINAATAGAALLGVAGLIVAESESATAVFGIPSAMALVAHTILLNKYKRSYLEKNMRSQSLNTRRGLHASVKVTPENFLIGKRMSETRIFESSPSMRFQFPLATLSLTF